MATTSSFIVAVAVITMCAGAVGQAPGMAPGPSSYVRIPPPPRYGEIAPGPYITMPPESMGPTSDGCFTYVLNMSDCLSYVQTGSNLTVPDKPCCPELAGLLESHPLCLCELVGSAATYGVNITKALSLPGACGLPPLSLSLCPGAPANAPAESAGTSGGSPETGTTAGPPAGSIAEPPNSLGASTIAGSSSLVFLLVIAISLLRAHF